MALYGMVWYACTCVSPIFWNDVIVIALANWQSDAAGSCHKSSADWWTTRHGQHDKADLLASHWTLFFLCWRQPEIQLSTEKKTDRGDDAKPL